jgi:hypothetical protein
MSRGPGKTQRLLLTELARLDPGYGVLLAGETRSASSSLRRAARSLAAVGKLTVGVRLLEGRHRLVAFPPRADRGSGF